MNYVIDKARFDDVEDLCATQITAIEHFSVDDYSPEEINAWVAQVNLPHALNTLRNKKTEVFVARDNHGMVMGFTAVKGNQITDIYVDPDHANKGIGTALLRRAEWHIRKTGNKLIRLLSTLNSVGFYKRKGYNPTTSQKLPVNDDVALDMVEMRKTFSAT